MNSWPIVYETIALPTELRQPFECKFINYLLFYKVKKILSFFIFLFFVGCEKPNTPNDEEIIFPEKKISYYKHVQPLFFKNCVYSSCHEQFTRASNLDLTSYSSLLLRFNDVIIPKDTTMSRIVWRIEGRVGFLPMPPTKKLTENQIKGIKIWIMEGATDTIP